MITSGILASYLVDYGFADSQNWRLMFGLAAIPAVILAIGILTQKESPHWLVRQGREDEARDVLKRLRAEPDVEPEIQEVKELARTQAKVSVKELFAAGVRPALLGRHRTGRFPASHWNQYGHLLRAIAAQRCRARQQRVTLGECRQWHRERPS